MIAGREIVRSVLGWFHPVGPVVLNLFYQYVEGFVSYLRENGTARIARDEDSRLATIPRRSCTGYHGEEGVSE